jgi:hypothetical protein
MTNIGSFFLILVCVLIGYVLEPVFFSGSKTELQAPSAAPQKPGEEELQLADESSEPTPDMSGNGAESSKDAGDQVDLSKITSADFPARVTLKEDYSFADEKNGVEMQLKKGVKVKPLRLEGGFLVIQPVGYPVEGKVNVDQTDFLELAVPMMQKRLQNPDLVQKTTDPADAQKNSDPEPEPVVEPDSVVKPNAVVKPDATPVVKPEVIPTEDSGTAEEPPSEDATAAAESQDDLVALMKASVAAGKVKEFDASQVVTWKVGQPMVIDGKTYQTGLVTFKAETILGMQEQDAIALIENGAVVKWMWAKTKLEMR